MAACADALRSSAVIFSARALPPFNPPKRPRSTAAGSLPSSSGIGSRFGFSPVRYIDDRFSELVGVPRESFWLIRRVGPVFRIGRNPMVRLLLGSKISDIASGALSGSYSNGPATALDHFGMKFRLLGHRANMRPERPVFQPGTLPQSN
jgi:hypothetical protein